MHPNSKLLFREYAKPYFAKAGRVLEIGPDKPQSTYQVEVGRTDVIWETLDLYIRQDSSLTYQARNEYEYPIADNQFDIVFAAQVAEHVKKIWVWVKELARVCKPGGQVIIINPVSWPYHEAPVDCWRIYPEGMKALYEDAGLRVIESHCESLHLDQSLRNYKYLVPGISFRTTGLSPVKLLVKRMLKIPIIYTLDTITIGVKEK